MRYFEIVKPPARHISANAEQRDAAGGLRGGRSRDQWRLVCANSRKPSDRSAILLEPMNLLNRRSRRRHLLPQRSQ